MMYEASEVIMRAGAVVDPLGRRSSSLQLVAPERERRSPSSRRSRRAIISAAEEEGERLDIVDLSGLSLEALPIDISFNLAAISKLDLSCNNLQVSHLISSVVFFILFYFSNSTVLHLNFYYYYSLFFFSFIPERN